MLFVQEWMEFVVTDYSCQHLLQFFEVVFATLTDPFFLRHLQLVPASCRPAKWYSPTYHILNTASWTFKERAVFANLWYGIHCRLDHLITTFKSFNKCLQHWGVLTNGLYINTVYISNKSSQNLPSDESNSVATFMFGLRFAERIMCSIIAGPYSVKNMNVNIDTSAKMQC